jgi:hypothetical protein
MRVKNTDAVPIVDMLKKQVLKKCRFPRTCFSDDVYVSVESRERDGYILILPAPFSTDEK